MSAPASERPSAYGHIVAASDVEDALLAQCQKWLTSYLAELDRQQGDAVGTLPPPRAFVITSDVEKMPEDQTPAVIVRSPGMLEPPLADGQGVYTARWIVEVSVHLSARGNALALRLARLYAAALRALLVQQQVLEGGLDVTRIGWLGERYSELDSIDDRTVCTATVELSVEVVDVTTRHAGPLEPLLPPEVVPGPDSPAWPTAETADVSVTKEPL